jgi:hypothetical protein
MPQQKSPWKLLIPVFCIAGCLACWSQVQGQQQAQGPSEEKTATVYLCPMHPEIQSAGTGKCSKCRMSLVRLDIDREKLTYACPKHPGIETNTPGFCWRCGETLLVRAALPEYKVELTTAPAKVQAGKSFQIRFRIEDPRTSEQVRDLHIVHEKPFHLFVISEDLSEYQHIHPIQQPDGSFLVETTVPAEGRYDVFSDFFPVGGSPQLVRSTLITAGARAAGPRNQARLSPDRQLTKVLDGIRFHLTLDPPRVTATAPLTLTYRLTDEKTGQPVSDLQPYLGAWGHTVVLSEDARHYVHSHPAVMVPRNARQAELASSPDISFNSYFPQPGRYRIWSQFQRHNRLTTVSFDIEVARLESIAGWDGKAWSALAEDAEPALNGTVRAIAMSGQHVYAGGEFTQAGSSPAAHIAKWNGRGWSALGSGLNGTVWAIVINGPDLYAGGEFTRAGETVVNGVAKWDGSRWSSLGEGVKGCRGASCSPAVYTLALQGNDLYAGGRFVTAGSVEANGIGRWNGQRWASLGGGFKTGDYDGEVLALAADGKFLYAGGSFRSAGGTPVSNVAVWRGNRWEALGTGIAGGLERVLSLASKDGSLYVGGEFSTAGGNMVSNGALWDGNQWSPLGLRTNGGIQRIAIAGADVYFAGAFFTLPSGEQAKGVVKWNGAWTSLGEGVANGDFLAPVTALAVAGTRVFAGGGPFALGL